MEVSSIHITVKGKGVTVPAIDVNGVPVIVTGKSLRAASVHDECWMETDVVRDPQLFLERIKAAPLRADYFTFAQSFTSPKPRYNLPFEWENIAAIPIESFEDWWGKRVSHELRKDVKRAQKRGVVVRQAEFDDEFVAGIKKIYDETPTRQGRRFWHYGKDVESVKRENATFVERATFIGAYRHDELIGFIKIVHAEGVARMMQIISLEAHQDKRPGNALIAKAVELCAARKYSYLTYGKLTYDNKRNSSVAQYKRRNGFEQILYPKYYVPITLRGTVALAAGLHLSWKRLIPEKLLYVLLEIRARAREQAARRIGAVEHRAAWLSLDAKPKELLCRE